MRSRRHCRSRLRGPERANYARFCRSRLRGPKRVDYTNIPRSRLRGSKRVDCTNIPRSRLRGSKRVDRTNIPRSRLREPTRVDPRSRKRQDRNRDPVFPQHPCKNHITPRQPRQASTPPPDHPSTPASAARFHFRRTATRAAETSPDHRSHSTAAARSIQFAGASPAVVSFIATSWAHCSAESITRQLPPIIFAIVALNTG